VLITGLEHHSNIVPWQLLAQQTGARLVVAPVAEDGSVPLAGVEERLSERTRLVSIAHVSNALGSVLPVAAIAERAHAVGARVLVDGAQAVPHLPVDLTSLGVDFYALSGHKLYGPTGIGVLWARAELLEEMPPYQGGGDMIRSVSFEKTTYADIPHKFEAGTPNIAGAIGLGAAVDYLSTIGMATIEEHERDLLAYGTDLLRGIAGLRLIGNAADRTGVLGFVVEGIHAHDLGTIADASGDAIRTGNHCAQPVMRRFGVPATARASLGIYSTRDDLGRLAEAIQEAKEMFS
jgi:cysteine desulfurase/selenocysteine lyase